MKSTKSNKRELSPDKRADLLNTLHARFEKNMSRHKGLEWAKVQARLEALAGILKSGEYIYCNCSAASPAGRRSICYDKVFLSHNGADSYYAARGFCGSLQV